MSDTKPDLDAIEARRLDAAEAIDEGDLVMIRRGATTYIIREDVHALVAYARTLEAELKEERRSKRVFKGSFENACQNRDRERARAEAAEAERDLLRDTLALRSAAHNRLAQRLDQIRHEVETYRAAMPAFSAIYSDHRDILTRDAQRRAHLALTYPRRALDGDQRTETP